MMDLHLGVMLQGAQSCCVQHHYDKWQFGLLLGDPTHRVASCFKPVESTV